MTSAVHRGFSLIELMVTVAVVALLLAAAVPAVGGWVADAKIRMAAEALQNAARLAQGESVRRSRVTMLALTADTPALNAAPTDNGSRWFVQVVERSTDSEDELAGLFVRGGAEPANAGVSVSGPALICFGSFGQLTAVSEDDTGLSTACDLAGLPKTYALSSSGSSKALSVQIALGGQVRMCDPSKTLSDDTPDGC